MTQFSGATWIRVSTLSALAILASACNQKAAQNSAAAADSAAKPDVPAVATVDNTPITSKEIDVFLQELMQGRPTAEVTPEQKAQVVDQFIGIQLLANSAVKDGLDKDPDTAAQLAVLRTRVLEEAATQKFLKGKEPTDADLKAEYDSQVATMDKSEYRARHILLATKEQAEAAIKKIKGGAKFEDVAKAESIDTGSKVKGGDLDWFNTSRMVKPFGDAVKGMKKGEMTQEPIQTQFGWHVIKLEDTREASPPAFDQMKPQLTQAIMRKKLFTYVEDLKKNAKIEKK